MKMQAIRSKQSLTLARRERLAPCVFAIACKRHASSTPARPESRGVISAGGAPLVPQGPGLRSSLSGIVATVFGAGGFVGRYLVNRLGRQGTQVVVPIRGDPIPYRHLRVCGDLGQILFTEYHLKDYDSILKQVQHSSVVFNLVGQDYKTRNFDFHDVHVEGAQAIARACKEAGVERLIHVSALNASVDSPSAFLQSKALGEEAVRAEFPAATIIRPANIFGLEDRYLNRIAVYSKYPGGVPLVSGGHAKKSPVFVGDVSNAMVNAMRDPNSAGKTFELVGPQEYESKDIVSHAFQVMRKKNKSYYIPFGIATRLAGALEKNPLYNPIATVDEVVRESLDDTTTGLPQLEDLNVTPTALEDVSITVLRVYRPHVFAQDAVDEPARV
eukprot:Colp12_sorted_trinity150504_noHs@10050